MNALLRPSLAKIVLAIILFITASTLWRLVVTSTVGDLFPWGFPLGFYETWGPCKPGDTCEEWRFANFWWDLLIWYLVSAVIVQRFHKRA